MELILEKAKDQLAQNLPFVIFKKPNDSCIIGLFQKNDELFSVDDFTETGFVFASFDGTKNYIIPENQSEKRIAYSNRNHKSIPEINFDFLNIEAKNKFEKLVDKAIHSIKNNEFKKVVLSRMESINLVDFDLLDAFENLVQLYPSTFGYCFFHPKIGIWLGATPEQLLKIENNVFETMALAGTQKDKGSETIFWKEKEKEEQQFVTDYIEETLNKVASEVKVLEPLSVKAGNIWHIKTTISGVLNSASSLKEMIQLLHPTPAVCGLPRDISKDFILENENYDRTFYTGFVGELNMEKKSNLFVNLRCMEICDSQAHLFMGCGITKDSIPEKEWEESVNKSATMKKIL